MIPKNLLLRTIWSSTRTDLVFPNLSTIMMVLHKWLIRIPIKLIKEEEQKVLKVSSLVKGQIVTKKLKASTISLQEMAKVAVQLAPL